MSAAHHEISFETEICEHLAANGWLYSPNDTGYDAERALLPDDVFGWLTDTQSAELAKVVKAGTPAEAKQREQLLDRLRDRLDTSHEAGGGTITVLRKGFSHRNAKFALAQIRPENSRNAKTVERYAQMRIRVMRQVRYSTQHGGSIDLVLFVNGIPVATLELKTDFTQSISDAVAQYCNDREPNGEPLLAPISGALVHFAVSNTEVRMTTKLAGKKTRFLPFNLGSDGGSGNPLNTHGPATAYLWERILERDTWLDIVGKFVFAFTETTIDPISAAKAVETKVRFPRLHQWDVVTELVGASRREGPGHRYLVQHSAGSGKTDSIAWTAHRLSRLHDDHDNAVFDTVIVITDRTVLDDQLQAAIRQIEPGAGYITTIDDDAIRDAGETSKSKVLAAELLKGTRIVVVTLQTFPHAMDAIRGTKGLAGRKFAVIADEAHSSQTGQTANKVRAMLSMDEIEALDDGGTYDVEAVLAAETAARADSSNISFYAFTATPKEKTLQLFGRPGGDGKPAAFHVYTMRQAIEEGYILDVLRGYQTYDLAFKIAQAAGANGAPKLVDQAAATKGLVRWVALHPTNIAQRVGIVVEHFRANVAPLLDGHAKAMVVTDSRKAAVRFKLEIDKYIKDKGYNIGTLVAFSGPVLDPESGPDPFTEASMNGKLGGQSIPAAFTTGEYRIMLVANKFQTGFDQPLLSAMYVFKRLDGIAAVQTLSRLNRTYVTPSGNPKSTTMVLDFVNDAGDIKAAFEPYYGEARIDTETDPNIVHDVAAKLDAAAIYTNDDLDRTAAAWISAAAGAKGNHHAALNAAVQPGQKRFRDAYQAALRDGDPAEIARLDLFRADVGTFVRVYDFMSQVIDYGDPDLEKRAIYLRLLERMIRPDNYTADVDLSDVTLVGVKQIDKGAADISLGDTKTGLKGITAAGSRAKRDPKMVALDAVIERLNDLFGAAAFTADQKVTFVEGLLRTLLAQDTLVQQAKVNTKKQFLESPDLTDGIVDAVADNQGAHSKMSDVFFTDDRTRNEIVRLVGVMLYEWAVAANGDPP